MIGQTISHYKITAKLGEGGMGVVYKAEDTRLDRIVALKFLAQDLMRDEENRKRFLREAKAAAGINHPNVCTVHEISDFEGRDFLALEYIDGETLDAKIAGGPLKVEEALTIARQVADGLAAAHEKNVVHRDIKPGNLMITADGRVKILDFGLALLTEKSKLTQLDTAVGTAAYMSPEQMQAQEVDHRTDIWALGCVLYEMVAAQRAFRGEYAQAMAYEIVHEEPEPLTGLRTGVPIELEFMVGKCLEKDAAKRYPNVADLGVDLGNLLDKLKSGRSRAMASAVGVSAGSPAAIQVRPAAARELSPTEESFLATYHVIEDLDTAGDRAAYRAEDTQLKRSVTINVVPESAARDAARRQRVKDRAFVTAVVLLIALSAAVVGLWLRSAGPAEPLPLRRFAYASPGNLPSSPFTAPVAISPNGKHIAVVGQDREGLWVQDLDQQQPRAIEGTAGAQGPFWSPDSNFIAFAAGNELKKVSVQGGASIRVCELPSGKLFGGSWSPDGEVIVFGSGSPATLYEVAVRGGAPDLLISAEASEPSSEGLTGWIVYPHFLPAEAGRRVLVFTFGTLTQQTVMLQDLESGRREQLGPGHKPFYSAGHIVFQPGFYTEDLRALPFSLETLMAVGEAFPIAQSARDPTAAADGTLVYFDGTGSQEERLAWHDRSGERWQEVGRPHPGIDSFDMSPDGRQAVVSVEGDIYVEDLERGVSTQLTFTAAEQEGFPVWAPWGAVFARGDPELLFRPLDRSREIEMLIGGAEGGLVAYDVDPGGRTVLYGSHGFATSYDILYLERSPDGSLSEPKVFLADPFETVDAQISPDGRHVAYSSRVTDRWDVLVQPFPDGGPQVQLTPEGGSQVRWNPNGNELFFVLEDTLYAVEVTAEPEFQAGKPRALFSHAAFRTGFARPRYDVAPGGDRFLLAEPVTDDEAPKPSIRVVQNWVEEFRDRERD